MLLLVACIDNQLQDKDPVDPAFDSGADSGLDTMIDDTSVPSEECNGVDDDADGAVDEGFPDDDGNGRVDCLDDTCPPLTLPTASSVPVNDACAGDGEAVDDPWNVVEEWSWTGSGLGVLVLPVVGNLTDDNGDGVVDDKDTPDIAYGEYGTTEVGLLSGDGSGPIWTLSDMSPLSQPLIADLDGDGQNEVVFFDEDEVAHAYTGDGTELWVADHAETAGYIVPTACDLDGDGLAELVTGVDVLNGEDGTRAFSIETDTVATMPLCEDLDDDGTPEIVIGSSIFDAAGNLVRSEGTGATQQFAAPIQADADARAELIQLGDLTGALYDDDGTELLAFSTSGTLTGPPCVADFDGDGASEFAIPSNTTLSVMEVDGTVDWSLVTGDTSGYAGCSAWDVDGDGQAELLVAGESRFRIFDGASGAELFSTSEHNSVTLFEYPVVADIDHDGSAEILLVNNANTGGAPHYGVTAFGHVTDGWPTTSPTWGMHTFSETNQDADGGIPSTPAHPWLDEGIYRARAGNALPLPRPDLRAALTDACIADCDYGPVAVGVQVENAGAADVEAGATLALYAVADTGERLVWSTTLPAIAAGTSLDAMEVDLAASDRGDGRWRLVIDEADAVRECDETNNSDAWNDLICP